MSNMIITVLIAILGTISVQAAIYTDSTNDQDNAAMDIAQVEVTNDALDVNFVITLEGTGLSSDIWARFGVGIDSVAGGSTTADAWNDKIIMSSGMDFWGGGWPVNGTNSAGMNIYDAMLGGWPEWQFGGDGSTWVDFDEPVLTNNTISFSIPLATLGLSAGDSFDFDVYSFWNDSFPADALGLSTLVPWAQYDSGTNVLSYTVTTEPQPATAYIDVAGTNVTIEFFALSNVSYYVQSTASLTQSWANASSLILGDGTTNSSAYPATNSAAFYRVVQP